MIQTKIQPGFWHNRLVVNAEKAIFHQWDQLVKSGCIENFRIAAEQSEGFREGWFFADSDAFKWLDAAARVYQNHPDGYLKELMDDFIKLIGQTQQSDGYIYTFNQIHFPQIRWTNLQIEHELYCHGHLIEAGVSHFEATGETTLLEIVQKAADRIVADFHGKGPDQTPGHQEIEIALLRLYQVTGKKNYLELAQQFIEQRGRQRRFGLKIFQQNISVSQREKWVNHKRRDYLAAHPEFSPFQVPAGNEAKKPWNITLRWMLNAITGKYFQQHKPVRDQDVPEGHSVRFAYLETAAAMLSRENGDTSYLPPLESCWEHMVTRRMYVTGGIGSLPALEGFGRDYELDPEIAYAETCAALGCMFWNWEMAQLTQKAQYSELFEWQLYNASAVGMGLDGKGYFYNNPLTCRGGVTRRPWYEIPCCPSNITRTWADLGKYLYTHDESEIWVHQYVNSETRFEDLNGLILKTKSGVPWQGEIQLEISPKTDQELSLHLRIPSWAGSVEVRINGKAQDSIMSYQDGENRQTTASGYDPRQSRFWTIHRTWSPGDTVDLTFDLRIQLHQAHPRVKGHQGKVALSHGPLVYCLESIDNPGMDIFSIQIDPNSLADHFDPALLGGTGLITAKSMDSQTLTFIPYHLWGNRGPSQMTVWASSA